ncbi:hypothetical protein ACIBKZ_09685 [Streptomyces sp. NPDC050421]|uniref:hypothetical protein n=1 Tax=Streptomyces sp. NPDC050421 TaxID=3365613 RepID=UPI00379E8054
MKARDIRATLDYLAQLIQQDATRATAEARGETPEQLLDAHRRRLATLYARPAETPLDDLFEFAARNLTRSGERLLAAKRDTDRAAATLQRVRDADTLADALTAVAEHDGLLPEAARAAANIAAAAEQPAAIDAERERDHAIRLAAVEQVKNEAVRVADRAHQTLLRVKHAPTAADAWTAIGAHFHMTSTDASRSARRWRSAAEIVAESRAQRAENEAKAISEQLRTAEERATTAEAALTTIRTITTPEAQQ